MEIIFDSHANKTHFHKKDFAPNLILKVRVFGTRKWPIVLQRITEGAALSREQGKSIMSNHAKFLCDGQHFLTPVERPLDAL